MSQRETKTEATEATAGFSPAATRRSTPRRYASAWAVYCSAENSRVTLTGMPRAMLSSIAPSPSGVPGILMKTFGRSTAACRRCAASLVASVSKAMRGETSSEAQPSTPSVRSQTGRSRSAAARMSSMAMSKNRSSSPRPADAPARMASS